MRLFLNCISLMVVYNYSVIGLIFQILPVYISSQIQQEQVYYIEKSINKMNLSRTYDKSENHIRIQYKNDIIANTQMRGSVFSFGSFVSEDTLISFNSNLYNEVLGCVILHELGHSAGLFHSNVSNSIMNYTLFIDRNGIILNDDIECELNFDDINGINFIQKKFN